MNSRHDIDPQKRKTLTIFGRVGAVATFASVSSMTAASVLAIDTDPSPTFTLPQELEITLVSSPDVAENSLIVKNISNYPVEIDSFHTGNIMFDDDVLDCNEICTDQALTLQPDQERVFWVNILDTQSLNITTAEYLDAQPNTSYLPQGTRVVTFYAKIMGETAYLSNDKTAVSA